jgi:hypothetical protein
MSNTTKFTQEEMQEIATLRSKYQEKVFQLGQVKFDEVSLKDAELKLKEKEETIINEWKAIQQEEQDILKRLADKYGDGSLNMKDGTFTKSETPVSEPELVETEVVQS